jgi:hypothetical protein
MPQSEARISTPLGKRYLGQLCKHFEHKIPVTLADGVGKITFDAGSCDLTSDAETLVMLCTADAPEKLARVEDVVARHLARFAFRDVPEIVWQPLG